MKDFIQSLLILTAVLVSPTGAVVVVYGQVGDTVTLPSPKTNSFNSYVYWYFGTRDFSVLSRNSFNTVSRSEGEQWKDRLSISGSDDSLIIKNLQQEHFGTFTCEVKDGVAIKKVTTYILYMITVSVKVSHVLAGEALSLACDIKAPQNVKPPIHWLNPQKAIIAGNQRPQGRDLFVQTVTGQHHGTWTCVVTSDNGEFNGKIDVTVVDLSPAPLHPQYTSVSSSRLTIPCSFLRDLSWNDIKAKDIKGGNWSFVPSPASSLKSGGLQNLFSLSLEDAPTWRVDQDRGLHFFSDLGKNLSLWRSKATEADRGEYICAVEFKGVTLKRSIRVEVLQILSSPGEQILVGQQVNLTCSLGHALASGLRVKWIPPQSCLPSLGPDPHPTQLTIPEVVDRGCRRWRCELWQNETQLTSAEITLKIEKAPMGVWLLVTICGAGVIFILIFIVTVILVRRRRQRMLMPRHHKRRFCRCKYPKPKGFHRT